MYKYLYELGKKDEDIVSLLGDCLVEKNQLKEAEKMYDEGMELGQVDSIVGMTLLKKNQGIEYTVNFKIPEEEKKNLEKTQNEDKFWGYIAGGRKLLMKKEKAIKNYEAAYNIADNKYQKSRAKYEIANVYHMNKDYDKVIDICKKEVEREWQFPGMYGLLLSAFINKEGFDYEQKKKVFEQGIKSFGFKELYRVDDYLEHEMYFNFYSMMSSESRFHKLPNESIKYSKMAEIYLTKEIEKNNKEEQIFPNFYAFILLQEIKKIFTKENYIYIPAGRSFFTLLSKNIFSIVENRVEMDYIFTQFGRLFAINKKEFSVVGGKISKNNNFVQNKYKELLKGEYIFEDDEDRLYISNDEFLPLNQISSGQQELLPALMILWSLIDNKMPTTIIFEEPEAHLFPKDQQRLIELLVYIFNQNKTKNRLIITTHSPYVLETFNNHLKKDKIKDIQIEDEQIQNIEALNPEKLNAYLLEKGKVSEILDRKLGLIDDKLLHSGHDDMDLYGKSSR